MKKFSALMLGLALRTKGEHANSSSKPHASSFGFYALNLVRLSTLVLTWLLGASCFAGSHVYLINPDPGCGNPWFVGCDGVCLSFWSTPIYSYPTDITGEDCPASTCFRIVNLTNYTLWSGTLGQATSAFTKRSPFNVCTGRNWAVPDDRRDRGKQERTPCGMPVWSVSEPYISLWLRDEPWGYQPALGQRIALDLAYKQRESDAGLASNLFSLGQRWNFSWFSYVSIDASGDFAVHFGGGGYSSYPNGKNPETNTQISGDTTNGFTLAYPDGSKDIYRLVVTNSSSNFLQAFLSERWDAKAQKTRFIYSPWTLSDEPVIRLLYVVDGDGRTNTVSYMASNPFSTNLISQIADPFGRSASFLYDDNGYLTNVTDVAGLSTSFIYDQHGWITNMNTPYGNTSFTLTDSTIPSAAPDGRSVLVTAPDGSHQLFLYANNAAGVASSYASGQVPNPSPFTTNSFDNSNLHLRNSFHWGSLQYANLSTTTIASFNANDFRKARMQHWLNSDERNVADILSLERDPSPDTGGSVEGQKIWYDYEGQTNSAYPGSQSLPLITGRVLPDGSTYFLRSERNAMGLPTRTVETYSTAGGLGHRTNVLTYAANDLDLLTITDAVGVQVSSNSYNAYHQVLTNYNALGEMTVFTYNGNQQLSSVALPGGLVTTNLYFTSGSGSNQLSTTIDYAVVGDNTVDYRTNSFTWANDLLETHTDPRGLTLSYAWDELQRLRRVDFLGSPSTSITNTYLNLDLVRVVDRMGFINSFGYDSMRRLTASTNANGAVTRCGYCSCGSLQAVTNAFGTDIQQITQHFYDNQGKLLQTIGPDGYSVLSSYNLLGQVTNVSDSVSSLTNWYNTQGLLVAVSNAFGRLLAVTYDVLDRPTTNVNADSVLVSSSYDPLHRLRSRIYPDSGIESFGYTPNISGVTSYTNQLGSLVANCAYDPLGRKTTEVFPGITTNTFRYRGDDLVTLTDGKNQITTWTFDQFGRTTNKVDATGTEILRYGYDSNNRMTVRWSRQKGNTQYSYDALGNNTAIAYPVSPSISLQYDLLNRLTNMVDTAGTTRYTYTAASQLQAEDGPWPGDTVTYGYTSHLRTSLSVQAPNASVWNQAYTFDDANRLKTLTSPAGAFVYNYDPVRSLQIAGLNFPNAAYVTNLYDNVSRLLSTVLRSSFGTNLNAHSYGYNLANQRTWLTNLAGDFRAFGYDNIGQLTSASATDPSGGPKRSQEQLGYSYDPAGNLAWRTNNALLQKFALNNLNQLTSSSNSGTLTIAGTTTSPATNVSVWGTGLASAPATRYADNTWARSDVSLPDGDAAYSASAQDNQGRSDTNTITVNLPTLVSFQYDANGNLTNDGLRSFAYDDENQLISVIVTNGAGGSTRSDFSYDGRMRRRTRVEYTWSTGTWLSNSTTLYVYDGNTVIQERDGNNSPVITYTRGRDLSGSLQGAGGIGGLLARTDHRLLLAHDPGATAYYHADAGGNITALISTNQVPVARYLYDPFGKILSQSGPLASANLYRFSSKEHHLNSGTSYYLFRSYDPASQKWLTPDPLHECGGMNLYGFVGNHPTVAVDPHGLISSLDTPAGAGVMAWLAEQALAGAQWGVAMAALSTEAKQFGAYFGGDCNALDVDKIMDETAYGAVFGAATGPIFGAAFEALAPLWRSAYSSIASALRGGRAILADSVGLASSGIRSGPASNLAAAGSEAESLVTFIDEGGNLSAGGRPGMRPDAYEYQSGAPGARSNALTGYSQAPYLEFTDASGTIVGAKFDGVQGLELIDRKLNPYFSAKAVNEAIRQAAVAKHYGLQAVWELPSPAAVSAANRFMQHNNVTGIIVRLAK
jgi:RHS repeat-associated protein